MCSTNPRGGINATDSGLYLSHVWSLNLKWEKLSRALPETSEWPEFRKNVKFLSVFVELEMLTRLFDIFQEFLRTKQRFGIVFASETHEVVKL